MPRRLCFAYGSNLNVAQMQLRCPGAKKLGKLILPNAQLVFRGVADVVYKRRSTVPGGLWQITDACEEALDEYEGVEHGLYRKVELQVRLTRDGPIEDVLVYQMNSTGIMPPSEGYLQTIVQGYHDFGLEKYLPLLNAALERSWDEKNKTRDLRRRHARKGRPPLAVNLGEVG